jgi:hypothetical protein
MAAQNGAQAAAEPQDAAPDTEAPAYTPTLEDALRLGRVANQEIGGLIARIDQLESRVQRVDRQVLVAIGMLALLTWTVKSLAGKVELADVTSAPAG